jgi:hypothetical protein
LLPERFIVASAAKNCALRFLGRYRARDRKREISNV